MTTTIVRILPDGAVKKMFETRDREAYDAVPRRATSILIVPEGPNAGQFMIDCSPLGPGYEFCLLKFFDDYDQAVEYEKAWVTKHWVLK